MSSFLNSIFINLKLLSKKEIKLYITSFCILLLSIFLTIFGQLPYFSTRGITQIFQIGWIIALVPLCIFFYKRFIRNLLYILLISIPFLIYLLLATISKIPAISYQGTTLLFLSLYIFLIGSLFSPFLNKTQIKLIMIVYLVASIIYAAVIYLSKLKGVDISGSIYAVSTKNSTGPILMIGVFCAFYIFNGKTVWNYLFKYLIAFVLIIIIALMKCRTVLICLPFIIFIVIFIKVKKLWVKLLAVGIFVISVLLIIFIPQLNDFIIKDILFNGKTNVDDIFSGRLTQISKAFENFKPIFGSGNSYVDCMPVSILATYGIVGTICLLPLLALPFIIFCQNIFKGDKNKDLFVLLLLCLFFFEFIFEGFGFIGPGAKSFIFWLMCGFECYGFSIRLENKAYKKIERRLTITTNKVSNNIFTLIITGVFCAITLLMLSTNAFGGSISESLYNKLPSNSEVTNYEVTNGFKVIKPVDNMCEGQRITFYFEPNNINYLDTDSVHLCTYSQEQTSRIKVDSFRNEITGINGWACYGISGIRNFSGYSYVSVVSAENYAFDKIYISNNPYTKSFEFIDDVNINVGEGYCTNVYYDNYYVPEKANLEFYSSDDNIAIVDKDTGIIKGVTQGSCEIFAVVKNKLGIFKSINKFYVHVVPLSSYVPTSEIDILCDDKCYQYIPFNFDVVFNKGATFAGYKVTVDGVDCSVLDKRIIFNEYGNANITVTSIANPTIKKSINVSVSENHPISFSCDSSRITVGRTYAPKDLGLYIKYSNGMKIIVNNDDLLYNPCDFSGRAWSEQNGMIYNRCTLRTVKTGSVSLKLVSNIDENVNSTFTFDVIKYDLNTYNDIIASISASICTILIVFSLFLILLIDIKNIYFKGAFCVGAVLTYLLLLTLLYPINITYIICVSIIAFVGIAVLLLNYIALKNKPLFYFCNNNLKEQENIDKNINEIVDI